MKRILAISFFLVAVYFKNGYSQIVYTSKASQLIAIDNAIIVFDPNESALVKKAAAFLQQDIEMVTGKKIPIAEKLPSNQQMVIFIGTLEKSAFIQSLRKQKQYNLQSIENKWEAFTIQSLSINAKSDYKGILLAGNDRRGAAYAVFELSRQMGVSPWYWWADVPVKKASTIYFDPKAKITDAPKVKYRGIFINDEAPALSNWSKEKFGGFNHTFYEKVFELMLRLKANYLWPAMWGNAFYYDDSLNIKSADEYGIVIGTSHHEPLMRAHEEWKYFGKGRKWNYDSTEAGLQEYWKGGMQRAWNEKIVSVGMRGDGDEPMTRETATALLERIVKDQRKIIADVTGKPAEETPQLWALYKEVQDYYDKGMRVPDDVTLLLCDDNWGNIRKLPKLNDKPRKGGYGIYYHFDYVGGPRNYKWINTNPLPRIWEQMHLAWEYKARQIWIVNVGDIKPMELPISFFLDYAWNPEKIGPNDIQKYTEQWAAAQFGAQYSKEIAEILSKYAKYNSRRKPELLDANTYSIEYYKEYETVVEEYNGLLRKAYAINSNLPKEYNDAYFQLVLHPVRASENLNQLYYNVALNGNLFKVQDAAANFHAEKAKELYLEDSLITLAYHQLNGGKWNHMMSQTHIGYTYWQQPLVQKMPEVKYLPESRYNGLRDAIILDEPIAKVSDSIKGNAFVEFRRAGISMAADHFTKAINSKGIQWTILPDHGRTGSAITTFPVTARSQYLSKKSPHLQYEIYTANKDSFSILAYFSPTLNFHNTTKGLQFAISIDDEKPRVLSINSEDKNTGRGIWNKWVSENIITIKSRHHISQPGKHIVKYWMVDSGVVLQKIVVDFGQVRSSYLGPPETRIK